MDPKALLEKTDYVLGCLLCAHLLLDYLLYTVYGIPLGFKNTCCAVHLWIQRWLCNPSLEAQSLVPGGHWKAIIVETKAIIM